VEPGGLRVVRTVAVHAGQRPAGGQVPDADREVPDRLVVGVVDGDLDGDRLAGRGGVGRPALEREHLIAVDREVGRPARLDAVEP
jgi:hypothetical protein